MRETLASFPIKTRLALTGTIVVARDIAHAKLQQRIDSGEGLPQYMKDHAVYYAGEPSPLLSLPWAPPPQPPLASCYAGPAKTPSGMASGSFGPTTAGRMDAYVDAFQVPSDCFGLFLIASDCFGYLLIAPDCFWYLLIASDACPRTRARMLTPSRRVPFAFLQRLPRSCKAPHTLSPAWVASTAP